MAHSNGVLKKFQRKKVKKKKNGFLH